MPRSLGCGGPAAEVSVSRRRLRPDGRRRLRAAAPPPRRAQPRTNSRAARKHLLDEPLPPGTGWWFVTGSILLFLLGVQLVTGVVLSMYYVPSTETAYDSIRFIMTQLTFGRVLRGLHFFGASFIVVAAVVHMLRVVIFGSYKLARVVTWITGVVLLLIILGF